MASPRARRRLRAVGQGAGGRLAHRLQVEEVDDLLDLAAMLQLSRRAPVSQYSDPVMSCSQQVVPPDHDVVEHAHVVEHARFWRCGDAERSARIRIEAGDIAAAVEELALVGVAAGDAIDDRGLAAPWGR